MFFGPVSTAPVAAAKSPVEDSGIGLELWHSNDYEYSLWLDGGVDRALWIRDFVPNIEVGCEFDSSQRVTLNPFSDSLPETVNGITLSLWFKRDSNPASNEQIVRQWTDHVSESSETNAYLTSAGSLILSVKGINTDYFFLHSESNMCDGRWHHAMLVWEATGSGGDSWVAIDGTISSKTNANSATYSLRGAGGAADSEIFVIGSLLLGSQSNAFTGCVNNVWFEDFAFAESASNVQKFRSTVGEPVDLGDLGETPTGGTPVFYWTGGAANSAQNFGSAGTPTVTGILTSCTVGRSILPTGLSSLESFGTSVLTPGAVTVSPTGASSVETFGTSVLSQGATLSPTGVASAEAFGTLALTLGAVTVSPTGVASAEAFGTLALTLGAVTVSPTGVASAEAFGTTTVSLAGILYPTGVASAEAFGTLALTLGAVTVSPTGVASAEAFGALTLNLTLSLTGISSAEAFGTASLSPGSVIISPSGISSLETLGSAAISTLVTLNPSAIASLEAFGTAELSVGVVTVSPTGIVSVETFGTASLTGGANQIRELVAFVRAQEALRGELSAEGTLRAKLLN